MNQHQLKAATRLKNAQVNLDMIITDTNESDEKIAARQKIVDGFQKVFDLLSADETMTYETAQDKVRAELFPKPVEEDEE